MSKTLKTDLFSVTSNYLPSKFSYKPNGKGVIKCFPNLKDSLDTGKVGPLKKTLTIIKFFRNR